MVVILLIMFVAFALLKLEPFDFPLEPVYDLLDPPALCFASRSFISHTCNVILKTPHRSVFWWGLVFFVKVTFNFTFLDVHLAVAVVALSFAGLHAKISREPPSMHLAIILQIVLTSDIAAAR